MNCVCKELAALWRGHLSPITIIINAFHSHGALWVLRAPMGLSSLGLYDNLDNQVGRKQGEKMAMYQ